MVFDSAQLLRRAKEGDQTSLGELMNMYRPYLLVLSSRYLDNRVQGRLDANDIVQQTFLEAHRDFPGFRGDDIASLLAWLRNILRNNVSTAHQRHLVAQRRTAAREIDIGRKASSDQSGESPGLADIAPSETTSPSQRVMRDEASAKLADSMTRLPETQSEAIRLRYLEGKSLKEIAVELEKTEMAVAGLLKRGLRSLRLEILSESEAAIVQKQFDKDSR